MMKAQQMLSAACLILFWISATMTSAQETAKAQDQSTTQTQAKDRPTTGALKQTLPDKAPSGPVKLKPVIKTGSSRIVKLRPILKTKPPSSTTKAGKQARTAVTKKLPVITRSTSARSTPTQAVAVAPQPPLQPPAQTAVETGTPGALIPAVPAQVAESIQIPPAGAIPSVPNFELSPLTPQDPPNVYIPESAASNELSIRQPTQAPSERLARVRGMLIDLAHEKPDAPEAPEALLMAAGMLEDLGQSRVELRNIVARYPESSQAVEALSRIGEYSFILADYEECVKALRAYISLETDVQRVRMAELQIPVALLRLGRFDSAGQEFEFLKEKYPDLKDAPKILESQADALIGLGEIGAASDLLQQIESRFPNYEFTVKVLMSRGLCAELSGDAEGAMQYYRTVADDYPTSIEAALAVKRMEDLADPLIPDL